MRKRTAGPGWVLVALITTTVLSLAVVSPSGAAVDGPAHAADRETTARAGPTAVDRAGTFAADVESGPPESIYSGFDGDDDGWRITGDAQGDGTAPEYLGAGGSPGGHICARDDVAGGTWYFSAPGKFLGGWDGAYGGTLTFDINQSSTADQFSQDDIVVRNETRTIVYDFGDRRAHPGTDWTSYSVPITASDPGWRYDSGADVSPGGFRTLLSNVTGLSIRGEYVSGPDRGCLDSVRLRSTGPDGLHVEDAVGVGEATATVDRQRMQWDAEAGRLVVPQNRNVTLHGVTNLPVGTNLTVQVNSKPGEESAFLDLQTGIYPRSVEDREVQLWEVTLADEFASAANGTEFELRIRQQGVAGTINPGTYIEGVVRANPRVRSFDVRDQQSRGDTVHVEALETTHGGYILLTDATGTELGRSARFAGDQVHENVTVAFEESLDPGDHEITATVYRSEDTPYPKNAVRTARIDVSESALPALFQVATLDPDAAQIEPSDDEFTVTARITNTGEREATKTVEFALGGSIRDSATVTLAGGEKADVTLTANTSDLEPGESAVYTVSTADGAQSGSVSVVAPSGNDTASEEGDSTDANGPGFGVGVALLALVLVVGIGRFGAGQMRP